MLVEIRARPLVRHGGHDRVESAGGGRLGRDEAHALENAGVVRIENDGAPVERAGVHDARRDLAPDAGQAFEPVHRLAGFHLRKMRQIDRPALFDQRGQAGLQALRRDVGVGLRRQLRLQVMERRLGHLLPRTVAGQQTVGRGIRDGRFRPRADHALHQHPFGLSPRRRRPLDPPEALDQERLKTAQGLGAGIGKERVRQICKLRWDR